MEAGSLHRLHETNERGQIMIRAVIIGFNSVFAYDETPHLRCFQQALAEHVLPNLEGVRPESIEPIISGNWPAEPSCHLPRR
jgi:hypothetical protein